MHQQSIDSEGCLLSSMEFELGIPKVLPGTIMPGRAWELEALPNKKVLDQLLKMVQPALSPAFRGVPFEGLRLNLRQNLSAENSSLGTWQKLSKVVECYVASHEGELNRIEIFCNDLSTGSLSMRQVSEATEWLGTTFCRLLGVEASDGFGSFLDVSLQTTLNGRSPAVATSLCRIMASLYQLARSYDTDAAKALANQVMQLLHCFKVGMPPAGFARARQIMLRRALP